MIIRMKKTLGALAMLSMAVMAQVPLSRPASHPSSRPTKAAPEDPGARKLFDQAASLQFPPGTPPRLDRVEARVKMFFFDQEVGGTKVTRSTTAEWKWLRRKRRPYFWRRAETETGKQTLCWGRTPWLQDERGRVFDLNERSQKKTRQQLRYEMQNIGRMMDVLVLASLNVKGASYHFGKRGLRLKRVATAVDEVVRELPGAVRTSALLGREDHRIYGANYGPDEKGNTYRFLFSIHAKFQLAGGTLLLPMKIRIDKNGRRSLELAFKRKTDLILNGRLPKSKFNPPLK